MLTTCLFWKFDIWRTFWIPWRESSIKHFVAFQVVPFRHCDLALFDSPWVVVCQFAQQSGSSGCLNGRRRPWRHGEIRPHTVDDNVYLYQRQVEKIHTKTSVFLLKNKLKFITRSFVKIQGPGDHLVFSYIPNMQGYRYVTNLLRIWLSRYDSHW